MSNSGVLYRSAACAGARQRTDTSIEFTKKNRWQDKSRNVLSHLRPVVALFYKALQRSAARYAGMSAMCASCHFPHGHGAPASEPCLGSLRHDRQWARIPTRALVPLARPADGQAHLWRLARRRRRGLVVRAREGVRAITSRTGPSSTCQVSGTEIGKADIRLRQSLGQSRR